MFVTGIKGIRDIKPKINKGCSDNPPLPNVSSTEWGNGGMQNSAKKFVPVPIFLTC